MDTEEDLIGQDDKKWDRVWTTEEIRKNSSNWTLAGDVGLYNLLNEFSQNIISRTHEVQNSVDSLVHNTKMASVKINNVINDFHMLSNVQFVENRVYDEELQESVPESKPAEKTKEQREAEMLPKIIKAVELGMSVLDKAFNRINVNEVSDSEDEDLSSEGRTILEAKNPYEHRPLPYIIGSEEFMTDDYAGLKDLIQEDIELSSATESSSTETDETSSEEEDLPLDDDKFSGVLTPRKGVESLSDKYSSSEESELFAVEKENGFTSDSSFEAKTKDTVAQKPKVKPEIDVRDNRQSSVSSMQSRLNLAQVLPVPKQPQKKKENENLFANDENSDEESPFKKKSGLFASDVRFEEEQDIFENDLFGSKPKEITKPTENQKAPPIKKSIDSQNKEPDLFGDDEDSEDDFFSKLSKVKAPSFSKKTTVTKEVSPDKAESSSSPSSAPSIKPSGNTFDFMTGNGNADLLFGDESDGDDLFSSKKTITKKFDFDKEEDDDLFGLTNEKKTKEVPVKKKPVESEKSSLFVANKTEEKSYKKFGMPLPGLLTKKPNDLNFEDSDNSEQDVKKTSLKPIEIFPETKKEVSIFDDDDEEDDIFSQKPKLFSPGKSPSVKTKPEEQLPNEEIKKELPKSKATVSSLFGSLDQEEDNEFSLSSNKKIDSSLFEENDGFDLFAPKTTEKAKQPDLIIPASVPAIKSISPSPTRIQQADDIQIGFDVPVDSSNTLNVLSKDRVKVASKRRKPTRKGRIAALQSNELEEASDSSPVATLKSDISDSTDDLFSSDAPVSKPAPTHKSQEKKKMDLMSQLMSEAASSKVGKKSFLNTEEEEDVDIFAELGGKKDSKSQSFSFKSPIESNLKSDFLEEDKTDDKGGLNSVLASEEGDNDDFFTEPSFKNFRSSISKKESILNMDDDDDDLFSIKTTIIAKTNLETSDTDIFADEADIFADIPKEKYEMFPSQLYDEDDDIFGNMDQSSNKTEKPVTSSINVKKENEKKLIKEAEKKPAFEDPLSGLLGDD